MGSLSNLRLLQLFGNDLTGTLCTELGRLSALSAGSFYLNSFTGYLPTELGACESLTYFDAFATSLQTTIPSELGRLPLTTLALWNNKSFFGDSFELFGSVPSELGNMEGMRLLYLHGNSLTYSVPTELGRFRYPSIVLLNDNSLTGLLPTEMGNWKSATKIEMQGNFFFSSVPTELGSLSSAPRPVLAREGGGNAWFGTVPVELCDHPVIDYPWLVSTLPLSYPWPCDLNGTQTSFRECPGSVGDRFNLHTLIVNPIPVPGSGDDGVTVRFNIRGTAPAEPVNGGTIKLTVSYLSMPVYATSIAVCEAVDCPIDAGGLLLAEVTRRVINLPPTIRGVMVTANLEIYNEAGILSSCIEFDVPIAHDDGGRMSSMPR